MICVSGSGPLAWPSLFFASDMGSELTNLKRWGTRNVQAAQILQSFAASIRHSRYSRLQTGLGALEILLSSKGPLGASSKQ